MINGILTVMPVFEADFLTANPSSTDDDSDHKEDRDAYHFHSNKSGQAVALEDPSTRYSVQVRSAGPYSDSQNSISPYASIPTMLSPRNTNQNIRIHAHCGTTSVQYIITNETALYSFASTVTHKYCVRLAMPSSNTTTHTTRASVLAQSTLLKSIAKPLHKRLNVERDT